MSSSSLGGGRRGGGVEWMSSSSRLMSVGSADASNSVRFFRIRCVCFEFGAEVFRIRCNSMLFFRIRSEGLEFSAKRE